MVEQEAKREEAERKRNERVWKYIRGAEMYEWSDPAKEAEETTELVRGLSVRFDEMEAGIACAPKENIDRVAWKTAAHREAYEEYRAMMRDVKVRLTRIGEKTGFHWRYEHEWTESKLTAEDIFRMEADANARDEYEYGSDGGYQ